MQEDAGSVRFSVLMSVYRGNTVKELRGAVDSLLKQTLPPTQIVVVVDGPVGPELDALLDDYADDRRFCIVRLPENVGLGEALRAGVGYCEEEYIARMDADDISVPDRFEKQFTFLAEHPDTDVLGGQIVEYDEQMLRPIAKRAVPCSEEEIKRFMPRRNSVNHVSAVIRKTSLIAAGNYMALPFFEDYYLWCRMMKNGCVIRNIDEVLVRVRTGNDMFRRRSGGEYRKGLVDFQQKIHELGITDTKTFLENLVIRLCVAHLPNRLRRHIYLRQLRSLPAEEGN